MLLQYLIPTPIPVSSKVNCTLAYPEAPAARQARGLAPAATSSLAVTQGDVAVATWALYEASLRKFGTRAIDTDIDIYI